MMTSRFGYRGNHIIKYLDYLKDIIIPKALSTTTVTSVVSA